MVSKPKAQAEPNRGKPKVENKKKRKSSLIGDAELFKAVVEHSHDAILFLDPERKILYASPAIKQISGYEPRELIGKHGFEFIHPDEQETITRKMLEVTQNPGKPLSVEIRLNHKNGLWFWVAVTATNFLEQPQVQAIVVNMRDITERRQNENELAQRAGNMSALAEISRQIHTSLNLDMVYQNTHQAIRRLMPCDAFIIALLDDAKQIIEDVYLWDKEQRWPGEQQPLGKGLTNYIISTSKALRVNDWDESHDRLTESSNFGDPQNDTRSILAMPLFHSNGKCFGMISAQTYMPHAYTAEHEQLMSTLSHQVSKAIENAKLFDELQQELAERQKAEQALRDSEMLYRRAIEVAGAVPYLQSYASSGTSVEFDFIGEGIRQITGYGPEEFNDQLWDSITQERILLEDLAKYSWAEAVQRVRSGANLIWKCEHRIRHRNGDIRWVFEAAVELRDEQGVSHGSIGMYQDITARKQAEVRQTMLYETLHAVSGYLDADEIAHAAVDTMGRLSGWPSIAISLPSADKETWQTRAGYGMLVGEYGEHRPMSKGVIGRCYRTGKTQNVPDVSQDPNYFRGDHPVTRSQLAVPIRRGQHILGVINIESENLNAFSTADVLLVESFADTVSLALDNARLYTIAQQEIFERKQAEANLRESQQRLSLFFNQSLDGFFFSMLDEPIEWNTASDKVKLIDYALHHQHITEANDAMIQQYGSTREKFIGRTALDFFAHDLEQGRQFRKTLFDNGRLHLETEERKDDGIPIWIEGDYVCMFDSQNRITGMFGIQRDVTSRKKADDILQEAETKYRNLVERLPQVIYTSELGHNGIWSYVSPQVEQLLGFTPQQWLADPNLWYRQTHLEDRDQQLTLENEANARNEPFESEYRMLTRAGNWIWVRDSGHILPSQSGGSPIVQGILMDISERKQAEEALSVSKAQLLANLDNTPNVAVQWYDGDGHILYWNPASESMYGWKAEAAIGKTLEQLIHTPEEQIEFMQILAKVQAAGKPYGPYEARIRRKDGTGGWVLATTFSLPMPDGQLGFVCMDVDITERKQAEELIQKQLRRLNALHTIDMAINSNANMQISLEVLLSQVLSQLSVDAANVLLFNQPAQTLELTASRGFRSNISLHSQQRLSDGFANQVINTRRTVHISNVLETGKNLKQIRLLANDAFVEYFGVPLIVKGFIKGVLEIYHRSPVNPEDDWLNFMEVLAGRAATAIDNAQLLQGLQRSNMEMALAYDATIEGWSRAMDLRDKETEGHTQRITAMTLKLARAMGIREADILHIQRGGLLHDIGKLGIPDDILLKTETLTNEEWQVMRQHPTYALNMISPIAYLKPALDIPYCHHEKWDGTGYPRGLKGEQIPLAARIFAVVDVWDALTSDRPYRKAWTNEKTIEYIQEQAEKHFDPKVVNAFLELISADQDLQR